MNVLMTSKVTEFFDSGFYVVASDPFPVHNRLEIDLVFDGLVRQYCFVGDIQAKLFLGSHDCDPKLSFEDYPALGGPDGFDFRGCVAFSENIRNHV